MVGYQQLSLGEVKMRCRFMTGKGVGTPNPRFVQGSAVPYPEREASAVGLPCRGGGVRRLLQVPLPTRPGGGGLDPCLLVQTSSSLTHLTGLLAPVPPISWGLLLLSGKGVNSWVPGCTCVWMRVAMGLPSPRFQPLSEISLCKDQAHRLLEASSPNLVVGVEVRQRTIQKIREHIRKRRD